MAYKRVIKGTASRKAIAVKNAGHPATFRKVRCPRKCSGYAVESNIKKGEYICERCGSTFAVQGL